MAKSSDAEGKKHLVKRCPECLEYLDLEAKVCHVCNQKVGPPNEHGMAKKPVNWLSYLISIAAIAGFALYMYWLFFLKE